MISNFYRLIYNQDGLLVSVNELATGATLPFDRNNKTFEETDPLVKKLREREIEFGVLPLADIVPEPELQLKNYRLNFLAESDRGIPLFRFPGDINYNTGLTQGLSTLTLDYFGLRVVNIFQQVLDATLLPLPEPVPIVYERYKYLWDNATGLPTSRVKEIQFYFEDGTLDERKKLLPKEFYNTSDRARITEARRGTTLTWLIGRSKELGLGTALEGFFSSYQEATARYVQTGDTSIIDLVNSSTAPWMDADTGTVQGTVRQAIALNFQKALEIPTEEEINSFLTGYLN